MSKTTNESFDLFDYLKAIPDIPNSVRGKEFTSKCVCGGTIKAKRSRYNGHLHAYCDKCKFRLIE